MEILLHLLKEPVLEEAFKRILSPEFLLFEIPPRQVTWLPLPSCNSCINCHLILNNFVLLHVLSFRIMFSHNLCWFLQGTTVLNCCCDTVPFLLNEGQEQTNLLFPKWFYLIALPFHIDSVKGLQLHPLIVGYSAVHGRAQLCRYPLD